MTRFRAYTTDSEDEEDDVSLSSTSEKSVGRELRVYDEDAQSESDSSMDEEEDLWQPAAQTRGRHKRSPVSEETSPPSEDDEMHLGDKDSKHNRTGVQFASTPKSPTPAQRTLNNPTIIPWARELGVDAQKMHVMQTSFFRMPEEEAALKALSQPTARRKPLPPSLLNRKHSRDSEGEGLRAESRQRMSFGHDIEPTPYRPSRKYARVECSASAVTGNEGAFFDAGLAFGRSFRVGWGPGGILVHLGVLCGPLSTPKTTANSSILQRTVLPISSVPAAEASELSSKLLSHHLSHTPIQADANGVPFASPSHDLSFSSFVAQFSATDRSFEASLFRLGHALFDPVDLRLDGLSNVDIRSRISAIRRKAALSNWLQDTISPSIDADLRDNPGADWASTVFALLTGNQADRACEVAMDTGSVKLASLISQYPGDEEFREDMQIQLGLWREQRVDARISDNVRKIYALLAGVVHVLEGSKGSGIEQCPDINIANELSWKRTFGLHLWFGEPMDASIADVLNAYDQLWKQQSSGVSPPLPWYTESPHMRSMQPSWKLPSAPNPPDALYSLIKLYADPACSLSAILAPLSFSPSPSDYRLAWHLYIIFSRCLRVRDFADRISPVAAGGVTDESDNGDEPPVEGHSPSADLLANSYALQLEQAGMIQEAVFVLLHIEGSAGRVKVIKELLHRSAAQLDDWMVRGLVGSLKLPMAWINEAKAMYAFDGGDVYSAYEFYLAAGLYNPAHELAVLELAPDAVIRQDLLLLQDLFDKFIDHPVDGWHVRGKLFLDYVHAMMRLSELYEHLEDEDMIPDAAQTAELEQLARSVPKLITMLPDVLHNRSDIRHNAALTEMIAGLTCRLDRVKPLAIVRHSHTLLFFLRIVFSHLSEVSITGSDSSYERSNEITQYPDGSV
ncbi:hypothetical protein AcV5_002488 [Taiwanofungus camphoratus]|nr:hypothetical protein AcV5_002488 [Antrodia cinnamomea]